MGCLSNVEGGSELSKGLEGSRSGFCVASEWRGPSSVKMEPTLGKVGLGFVSHVGIAAGAGVEALLGRSHSLFYF